MRRLLAVHLATPERLSPSEFTARHRMVLGGDNPGPWRHDRTPYLREIMDAAADESVRCIVICKGSQSGGTEALINILAWSVDQDPGQTMVVFPDATSSRQKNLLRFLPEFRACAPVAARMSTRPKELNTRFLRFDRMDMLFRGSFSEHQIESDPCRRMVVDELDRCPPRTAHLAKQRVKTFARGQSCFCGKPRRRGEGIDLEYSFSDRRRYHVPCPRCGVYHVRSFRDFRWEGRGEDGTITLDSRDLDTPPDRVGQTAACKCRACGVRIPPELNAWQLAMGRWAPSQAEVQPLRGPEPVAAGFDGDDFPGAFELRAFWGEEPGAVTLAAGSVARSETRGYHVPEWISGLMTNPYAPACVGYVRRRGVIDMDWVNDHAGEGWQEAAGGIEAKDLKARRLRVEDGGYLMGTVPAGVLLLTAHADVQDDCCYVEVRGWGAHAADRWLILAERVPFTGDLSALDEIFFRKRFARVGQDASFLTVAARVVDSGDGERTSDIYAYCRTRRRVWPVKGVGVNRGGRGMERLFSWSTIDTDRTGRALPQSVRLLRVNSPAFKSMVTRRLRAGVTTAGQRVEHDFEIDVPGLTPTPTAGAHGMGLWHFAADTPDWYLEQLTAEVSITRLVHGRRVTEWVEREGSHGNHMFDCAVYGEALAEAMNLRQRLAGTPQPPATSAATPPTANQNPTPTATLRAITRENGILAARRREQRS